MNATLHSDKFTRLAQKLHNTAIEAQDDEDCTPPDIFVAAVLFLKALLDETRRMVPEENFQKTVGPLLVQCEFVLQHFYYLEREEHQAPQ